MTGWNYRLRDLAGLVHISETSRSNALNSQINQYVDNAYDEMALNLSVSGKYRNI